MNIARCASGGNAGGVTVRVVGALSAERVAMLRGGGPGVRFQLDSDAEGDGGAPAVVFVWEQSRRAIGDVLRRHPGVVRWVHFRRVGLQPTILELFDAEPDTTLTSGSGASGIAVAEHVLAVTFALYKRLPELHDRQREHVWMRNFPVSELRGQTATIVGLGDLGRSSARLLRAMGVRLLGVRRAADPVAEVDETYQLDALPGLLERSNLVVLAAPLTPETRELLGAAELARLPRGSYLVNVGRGALVNEPALIDALRTGHLGGAGLDVFAEEPLNPASPLWDLPNVIITPHAAAHTEATDDRSIELFLSGLDKFRRGAPLDNIIDRTLRY